MHAVDPEQDYRTSSTPLKFPLHGNKKRARRALIRFPKITLPSLCRMFRNKKGGFVRALAPLPSINQQLARSPLCALPRFRSMFVRPRSKCPASQATNMAGSKIRSRFFALEFVLLFLFWLLFFCFQLLHPSISINRSHILKGQFPL